MEREKVKQLLAKIEVQDGVFGVHGNERETAINALSKSVPIIWFEQFARLVEQETLERAARVAEKRELHDGDFLKNSDPRITIADEIRNLKDNHEKE